MREDYKKHLREVDLALNRQARADAFYEKVRKYYNIVKKYADKEIENGKEPIEAIDCVFNSNGFNRLYPELAMRDDVKRKIRSELLTAYFKKGNRKKEDEDEVR